MCASFLSSKGRSSSLVPHPDALPYRVIVHRMVKSLSVPGFEVSFEDLAFVGTGWSWKFGGVYSFSMEDFA